jgi:two-component system, LuxR family, response regulator FixJ
VRVLPTPGRGVSPSEEPLSQAFAPQVAIVDDDEAVGDALSALLRAAGWTAVLFLSPLEALASPLVARSECLLVDVHMPGLDGIELVHRLRAGGVQVPVIFMTARIVPGLETAAEAAGGRLLLEKPFAPDALIAALHDLLGG